MLFRLFAGIALGLPASFALARPVPQAAPSSALQTAQPAAPQPELRSHPDWPRANPADVDSIEDIVHAFYSAISAPAGGKLNQNRLRSLFTPAGRIAVGLPPRTGTDPRPADVLFSTPEQYAADSDSYTARNGFFDRNPANQIERFGVMAHVYSTYESRNRPGDPNPLARGIKSFELLNSNNRWYILQVYWDSERPDNPIPTRYQTDHTN